MFLVHMNSPFSRTWNVLHAFYDMFSIPLFISIFIGLSFATVGEAVLVPILEELKVVQTKLGRVIIAIGILDDVFELFTLVILSLLPSFIPGFRELSSVGVEKTVFALFCVFTLAYILTRLTRLGEEGKKFKAPKIETLFTVIFFVLFSFVAIGKLPGDVGDLAPLGALFAGVPKIVGSYIIAKKELGKRDSILLGVALCTRFSTSIIIARYLLSTGIISQAVYSTLIVSTAVFTLSIPFTFSYLLNKSFHKSDFVR